MEMFLDSTEAGSVDSIVKQWSDLFWVARMLAGDDDSAILCLLNAMDWREATRRKVIQAACVCLSREIKMASLRVSNDGNESRLWDGWPTEIAELSPDPDALREALVKMDLFLRFVWVLRFAEGYSRNETARLLSVDEALVESAMRKSAIDLTYRLRSPKPPC